MTTPVAIARHRADKRHTTNFSALAKAVTENAGGVGRQAAVIAAASGLVLTGGVSANAADLSLESAERTILTSTLEIQATPATVEASADAEVAFNRTPVKAVAAPAVVEVPAVVEAPAVTVQAETVVEIVEAPVEVPVAEPAVTEVPVAEPAVTEEVTVAPAVVAEQVVDVQAVTAAPAAEAPVAQEAPEVSSGVAATIAAAAQGQLGVTQDCTRLVSNSLAAAGINFHGWPAGYLSLGRTVGAGEAIPGDLIYYADGGAGVAHIAVYIGGGKAVHGGFNGNQTVVAPADLGSGPVFIRVGG
ncbi:NlpC/P60 family protein [Arthrobacter sp. H20]|uniref:NlpC/P60 family protein n=1 Tax=Arthrobacter sp. H20 TaxID=1267981 RepID=UPI00047EBB89|nr:NlpC/P60 family protein [Arthrobacter sp. H20]